MHPTKIRYYFQAINSTILGVILVFILIAGITTSFFSLKLSSNYVSNFLKEVDSTNLYYEIFRSENHFFPETTSSGLSFSKLFFQVATNIKLDDTRTLLGRELPLLTFYHTDIIVAEKGTTIANLPYESTPSEEILKNPKEANEESIEKEQTEEKEDTKPIQVAKTKKVFIYQTHNLESYLPLLKNTTNPNDAISADPRVNVVSLGSKLTSLLQKEGIGVEHDKTNFNQKLLDRKWSYSSSYTMSKEIVKEAVAVNNDLTYLIDIHRDSSRRQATTTTINGKSYARLVFVIGQANKNYEKNTEFAKKLNNKLKEKYPGISRGILGKAKTEGNGIYNQDFSDKAILLEVGGVDNNQAELKRSMEAFADVFSEVYWEENNATEQ
ncbi:stage II sporulation protein P [Niallia sp. NCCP-28]|uniref:stage II sporulation protein P n=1 Tax=Niallia sp. NCCP-28 TaxID=2934712 RepID=UPI00208B5495|nr:stage II sporulation protein P [Niallia sp. NCCP-28]GKU83154.1 stage II sporulation protein P [Niallia sp. NCCP-28]